ncbi:HepT-like ribonuclease domain-containing protein [Selenomonas sp.]|uniref:HepT-like ribonuclease domain-containing protein n=1 Tax=Selenomonas sp. TaxID=2053611 RepID=UPI0025F4A8A7|nr:HepT-like ribonuclease domain-containing protein [Selenomonas sp.]MCI6283742.1 DUF86 domain-containing protein [Selenomonas sp.]
MQHRDKIVLQKILAEIDIGTKFLGDVTIEVFLQDEMKKRAIGMTVINIGELVKNVTMELREAYPNVPWKAIAGFRDITAHRYQTLRMEDVYASVQMDFPMIRKQLTSILKNENEM